MNGNGNQYGMTDKMLAGSIEPFTKEQRQRLEALTFARRLAKGHADDTTHAWVMLAQYIDKGTSPFR